MVESKQTNTKSPKNQAIPWEEFLASYPPGKSLPILQIAAPKVPIPGEFFGPPVPTKYFLRTPDLKLYCCNKACNGERFFQYMNNPLHLQADQWHRTFLDYRCRNCRRNFKSFAIEVKWSGRGEHGEAMKFGERPPFGPHVPARVITLIREDRELFNMGQRAESQGMGIGAFAYYRRVVEHQKGRIIDEIIRVAQRIKAPEKSIEKLKSARGETQFKAAVKSVKAAIPQVLLINGHNPLTLLHDALSKGLHAQSDKECLELATSIRTILTDLAERLGQALKEQAELDKAVTHLIKSKSEKGSKAEHKPQ